MGVSHTRSYSDYRDTNSSTQASAVDEVSALPNEPVSLYGEMKTETRTKCFRTNYRRNLE
jgi:hypothetical protein